MRRLRSRLVFAFLCVALLAMIPVAIIPYYSFNEVERLERHQSIEQEIKDASMALAKYQNQINMLVLQPAADYFYRNTFRSNPEVVSILKTAEYPYSATSQERIDFYNNFLYENYLPPQLKSQFKEGVDLRLMALSEYISTKQTLGIGEDDARVGVVIEDGDRVYQWQIRQLFVGAHRDDMETVGAIFIRTPYFEKNQDEGIKITNKAGYLSNFPIEIIHARPSEFEGRLPEDAMEKLFDFNNDGDFRSVELTSVSLPFISNGAEMHMVLTSIINQFGDPTAILIHSRPVVEVWIFSYPATQISFIVTLLAIIVIAALMARSIAAPLHRLASAASAMANGNFDVRIEERGSEEQQVMSAAFNQMAERIQTQIGQLAQTQRFLESVLEGISTGVMSIDRNGLIRLANPAGRQLFRLTSPEGKPVNEAIAARPFNELVKRALKTKKALYEREIICELDEDTSAPLQVSAMPMMSEGQLAGLVVTFHDLSEIRKLEDEVRRQDRLASLGRMSAGVAHEIRNPLGIIRGSAQMLQKRFGGQPGEEGMTDFIIDEVNRLSRVLNDFLQFARPPEPIIQDIDAAALVEQIKTYADNGEQGGAPIRIEVEIEPGLEALAVDPALCREAFLNLIINAKQAMPDGGAIAIRALKWGEFEAAIEIADEGVGITPEQMDRIFDPFFTSKDTGTGLGLSLVHQIISSHGGRIEVESMVSQGSLFRVILPTIAVPEPSPENMAV